MCEIQAGGLMSLRRENPSFRAAFPGSVEHSMFPCSLWLSSISECTWAESSKTAVNASQLLGRLLHSSKWSWSYIDRHAESQQEKDRPKTCQGVDRWPKKWALLRLRCNKLSQMVQLWCKKLKQGKIDYYSEGSKKILWKNSLNGSTL